eukprot:1161670-Pelagomonas_calceolata.AAC.15
MVCCAGAFTLTGQDILYLILDRQLDVQHPEALAFLSKPGDHRCIHAEPQCLNDPDLEHIQALGAGASMQSLSA